MVIVFLGPPASGKGTQAQKLAERLGFYYLSTGQLLRSMQEKWPGLAEIMNKGDLLPDETVISILSEYLENKKKYDNLVIDGSPRSAGQYKKIQEWLKRKGTKIDWAIFLVISKATAVKRLSARRQDKVTGQVYNLLTNPPDADVNPKNLIMRDDDNPEVIGERFEEYHEETEPLISLLRKEGILIEVNGENSIDTIFKEILEKLGVRNE